MTPDHFILAFLAALWCALHSLLIGRRFSAWWERRLGAGARYHRLLYNLFAVATLVPVLGYAYRLRAEPWFDWSGPWRVPQALLLGAALTLFLLGARKYDARRFLGLRQIREGARGQAGISASGGLDTSGVLQFVRHPWYSGLLLALWARPLDAAALVLNTVFSLYLLIGSRLEERRLMAEFGDAYRAYRQEVSALVPVRWLRRRLGR